MPFVLCLYLRGLEIIDKTAEELIRKLSEYYPSQKIPLHGGIFLIVHISLRKLIEIFATFLEILIAVQDVGNTLVKV